MSLNYNQYERLLLLEAISASNNIHSKGKISNFQDVEYRVFSQFGEDGILDWLVAKLGGISKTFIEFGVENYKEANTRYLMLSKNWRGLVMDNNNEYMSALRNEELYWRHDIQAITAFVDRESINDIFSNAGFMGELGILSIDIDGNDYWVFEAINCVKPTIIVCEYNPILGDKHSIVVPYDKEFSRFNAHYSGLYFGASINALIEMANSKGYKFVGTCSNGINAFFVSEEAFITIDPLIDEKKAWPSKHRDSRDEYMNLNYVSGLDRIKLIEELPVVDINQKNCIKKISDFDCIYSDTWIKEMIK